MNVSPVQAYMSDALGVGAFLESSDEQVVLMKRGEHLAEAPELWDIPGGHPEPQVVMDCASDGLIMLIRFYVVPHIVTVSTHTQTHTRTHTQTHTTLPRSVICRF